MAKPKGVLRLKHRKEPHLEVHIYQDPETKRLITHIIDYERGQVTSFKEKELRGGEEPAP